MRNGGELDLLKGSFISILGRPGIYRVPERKPKD